MLVVIKNEIGEAIGHVLAEPRTFLTGSRGHYGAAKVVRMTGNRQLADRGSCPGTVRSAASAAAAPSLRLRFPRRLVMIKFSGAMTGGGGFERSFRPAGAEGAPAGSPPGPLLFRRRYALATRDGAP